MAVGASLRRKEPKNEVKTPSFMLAPRSGSILGDFCRKLGAFLSKSSGHTDQCLNDRKCNKLKTGGSAVDHCSADCSCSALHLLITSLIPPWLPGHRLNRIRNSLMRLFLDNEGFLP